MTGAARLCDIADAPLLGLRLRAALGLAAALFRRRSSCALGRIRSRSDRLCLCRRGSARLFAALTLHGRALTLGAPGGLCLRHSLALCCRRPHGARLRGCRLHGLCLRRCLRLCRELLRHILGHLCLIALRNSDLRRIEKAQLTLQLQPVARARRLRRLKLCRIAVQNFHAVTAGICVAEFFETTQLLPRKREFLWHAAEKSAVLRRQIQIRRILAVLPLLHAAVQKTGESCPKCLRHCVVLIAHARNGKGGLPALKADRLSVTAQVRLLQQHCAAVCAERIGEPQIAPLSE